MKYYLTILILFNVSFSCTVHVGVVDFYIENQLPYEVFYRCSAGSVIKEGDIISQQKIYLLSGYYPKDCIDRITIKSNGVLLYLKDTPLFENDFIKVSDTESILIISSSLINQ